MSAPPLLPVGAGPDGLRFRALVALPGVGALRLYCQGIEVAGLALAVPLAEGDVVALRVTRLPLVPLPAALRLAAGPEGPELAEPVVVADADAALRLLGPTPLRLTDLRLEHGMLRGTGLDRVNGLLAPVLTARVNGMLVRPVLVEPPMGLPEGGCAFRFAVPLEPADLHGAGLSVTLHAGAAMESLARFAWAPVGAGAAEARVAELEARILRLERLAEGMREALEARIDDRFGLQQEKLDAFLGGCAALLLDGRVPEAEAPARLAGLLAPPPRTESRAEVAGNRAELLPDDRAFDLGWHAPEEDALGPFRWMTGQALVRNPAPDRKVAAVTIEVLHLYGAPAPLLEAMLDAAPCPAVVERVPGGAGRFRVRLVPPGGPLAFALLRLQSRAGGIPAEDGVSEDSRQLSVAVAGVAFDYAGQDLALRG